jgi:hypothetical protein
VQFTKQFLNAVTLLSLLIFSAQAAHAQTYDYDHVTVYIPPVFSQAGENNPASWQRNSTENSAEKNSVPDASLMYISSQVRTMANLAAYVEAERRTDPARADLLKKIFASADVLETLGTMMKEQGLSMENIADAYAVYWINAFTVANNLPPETRAAAYIAVSDQIEGGLSSQIGALRNHDDTIKQQIAERLLIQAWIISIPSKSNAAQQATFRKQVVQAANSYGLPVDGIDLTEKGFVKAER